MQAAISDDFLAMLTAVGDEDAVRAGVERYRDAGATSPCVGPIPKTDFEATLRAAAPGRVSSSTARDLAAPARARARALPRAHAALAGALRARAAARWSAACRCRG